MATFAELFCEQYGVAPEKYARAMLWRCLHRRGLAFVLVAKMIAPDYFAPDLELIDGVGRLTSPKGLKDELEDFHAHPRNHGFSRRWLRIRVSGGRLTKLVHRVFAQSRAPFAATVGSV